MKTYETPPGRAGSDQLYGMTESVQAELEQMFWQKTKLDMLSFGVGRTVYVGDTADARVRLDAQMRECQAQMTFHAGRALELAMHIVYARGADRILGREYPGVEARELRKDRKTHSLSKLYGRIKREFADKNMCDAFEEVYQEALHRNVTDLRIDDELHCLCMFVDDQPFVQFNKNCIIDGAEMTLDHADPGIGPLSSGEKEIAEFEQFPFSTFSEFLNKADSVYYRVDARGQRENMRWTHYSARDHEYGRPYVVAGARFFARLVKGLIDLSNQQWTWHPEFRQRQLERRQYNIDKIVRVHLQQSYQGDPELPEMMPVEEMEALFQKLNDGRNFRQPEAYKNLHRKLQVRSTNRRP
ncbi:MAG: hypothetical protein OXQ29_10620 [Rhodospirillaceae bacterium]|nr:hypothetical protein [Rhodospirillaceae bacterium]